MIGMIETRMFRMVGWLTVVMLLGALVVACGGGDDDDDNTDSTVPAGATATTCGGGTASATAEATEASGGGSGETPAGTLVISGDISMQISEAGACSGGALGSDLQFFATHKEGTEISLLQIYVNNFDENGPGDYDASDQGSSYDASIGLTNQMTGAIWQSSSELGGTITVNDDRRSGSVEAELVNEDGTQHAQIVGDWVCAED